MDQASVQQGQALTPPPSHRFPPVVVPRRGADVARTARELLEAFHLLFAIHSTGPPLRFKIFSSLERESSLIACGCL